MNGHKQNEPSCDLPPPLLLHRKGGVATAAAAAAGGGSGSAKSPRNPSRPLALGPRPINSATEYLAGPNLLALARGSSSEPSAKQLQEQTFGVSVGLLTHESNQPCYTVRWTLPMKKVSDLGFMLYVGKDMRVPRGGR